MRQVAQNKKPTIILNEIDSFEDLDIGLRRCEGADWKDLAQCRVAGCCEYGERTYGFLQGYGTHLVAERLVTP